MLAFKWSQNIWCTANEGNLNKNSMATTAGHDRILSRSLKEDFIKPRCVRTCLWPRELYCLGPRTALNGCNGCPHWRESLRWKEERQSQMKLSVHDRCSQSKTKQACGRYRSLPLKITFLFLTCTNRQGSLIRCFPLRKCFVLPTQVNRHNWIPSFSNKTWCWDDSLQITFRSKAAVGSSRELKADTEPSIWSQHLFFDCTLLRNCMRWADWQ